MKKSIIIILTTFLFGCGNINDPNLNNIKHLTKSSYSIGYIDGVNAITKMVNDGSYSFEKIKLKATVDSMNYAYMIDTTLK